MACCDACASGESCSCSPPEQKTCTPCAPFSPRALELLKQDRDPSTSAAIPALTTASILPPARGGAVYNYSCARYILKNDDTATVPSADLTGIRWVTTIDPTGAAAVQEGLNSRSGSNFLCGDECKSFPIEAGVIGDDDLETLELQVTNSNAVGAAAVTLEIYGRALCVPMFQPVTA